MNLPDIQYCITALSTAQDGCLSAITNDIYTAMHPAPDFCDHYCVKRRWWSSAIPTQIDLHSKGGRPLEWLQPRQAKLSLLVYAIVFPNYTCNPATFFA